MGFFTSLFGIEDDIAAGEEADRRNAELSRDLHRRGLISDAELAGSLDRYSADGSTAAEAIALAEEQTEGAFLEELAERSKLGNLPSLLPWQAWVLIIVLIGLHLGLFKGLFNRS